MGWWGGDVKGRWPCGAVAIQLSPAQWEGRGWGAGQDLPQSPCPVFSNLMSLLIIPCAVTHQRQIPGGPAPRAGAVIMPVYRQN